MHPSSDVSETCRIYAKVELKLFWLVDAQHPIKTLLVFPLFGQLSVFVVQLVKKEVSILIFALKNDSVSMPIYKIP